MVRFEFNTDVSWIKKLGKSGTIYYGSGEEIVNFPVYFTKDKLELGDIREELLKLVYKLGERTKDMHEVEPVQDLICPDLFPNRLIEVPHPWLWSKQAVGGDINDHEEWTEKWGHTKEEFDKKHANNFPKGTAMRLGYFWRPSEFVISPKGDVEIISEISGLDWNTNKSLYNAIAKLFAKMVPMWSQLGLIKTNEPTQLQVVVKAQSYLLEPGVKYSGKWHREGFRENIVASGVYYAEIEEGLSGGDLKFRDPKGPSNDWLEDAEAEGPDGEAVDLTELATTRELEVYEGRAVVFDNKIPHRFRALCNYGDKLAKRTFFTFFVVDPSKRIPGTADICIILLSDFRTIISSVVKNALGLDISNYVIDEIHGFRGNDPKTLEEAKTIREEFRAAIREDKTGFCEVGYGNCGNTEFIELWETPNKLSWEQPYGDGFHSQSIEEEKWSEKGLDN